MTLQYLDCDNCGEEVIKGASHRGDTLCEKCKESKETKTPVEQLA